MKFRWKYERPIRRGIIHAQEYGRVPNCETTLFRCDFFVDKFNLYTFPSQVFNIKMGRLGSKNRENRSIWRAMTESCSFCGESFQHFFGLGNMFSTSLNIVFSARGKVYFPLYHMKERILTCLDHLKIRRAFQVFFSRFLTIFTCPLSPAKSNKKRGPIHPNFSGDKASFFSDIQVGIFYWKLSHTSLLCYLSKKVCKCCSEYAEEHKCNHYTCNYSHCRLSIFHDNTSPFIFYFLRNTWEFDL